MGLGRVDDVRVLDAASTKRRRVYLDTTATALMPRALHEALGDYFETACANSHTTAHRAGRATTDAIDLTRNAVGELVGYDPEQDIVLLPGNGATGAINFLARALFPPELRMPLKRFRNGMPAELRACIREHLPEIADAAQDLLQRPLVVTSLLEHHSNILPWVEAVGRHNLRTVGVFSDGRLNLDGLERVLAAEGSRVRLVAISGASNVTGVVPPIHEIARMTHAAGARLLVDAAQLAPHRPIAIHPQGMGAAARLDFVALSGHKLYAPGSRGVLVGSFAPFERRRCIGDVGGGMVEYVSVEDFRVKDEITAREEAGTPNIPGTLSLGMIARLLAACPMQRVALEEDRLVGYALERLQSVPNFQLFGPTEPQDRLGVFSFLVKDVPYQLVAAYLDDFHNIAVRDGCFCAHPYVKALLNISPAQEHEYLDEMAAGDRRGIPGMVRASFGVYSTRADVDALCAALTDLVRDRHRIEQAYVQQMDGGFVLRDRVQRGDTAGERECDSIFTLGAALSCLD